MFNSSAAFNLIVVTWTNISPRSHFKKKINSWCWCRPNPPPPLESSLPSGKWFSCNGCYFQLWRIVRIPSAFFKERKNIRYLKTSVPIRNEWNWKPSFRCYYCHHFFLYQTGWRRRVLWFSTSSTFSYNSNEKGTNLLVELKLQVMERDCRWGHTAQ